ncbi:hypothetical protein BD311DRAFT_752244 [Dichomitus squalens]|uniref:Uncharacterized protein n=1 Tax=Dichomitus squalens TaxID=114155 RepID=A0A4Q9MUV6_9APHY|nr:hypothetical protein BD311DRAFT_752244 [Dichomitus squalens]
MLPIPGDKTLNTLLKDVVLKVFVVVYHEQSPTQITAEAIQYMLDAARFVQENGDQMTMDQLQSLSALSEKVYSSHQTATTRWRDVLFHPARTIMKARDFKADARVLLHETLKLSAISKFQYKLQEHSQSQGPEVEQALVARAAQIEQVTTANPAPSVDLGLLGGPEITVHFQTKDTRVMIERGVRANVDIDGEGRAIFHVRSDVSNSAQAATHPKAVKTASIYSVSQRGRLVTSAPDTAVPAGKSSASDPGEGSEEEHKSNSEHAGSNDQGSEGEPAYRFQFDEPPKIVKVAEKVVEEEEEVWADALEGTADADDSVVL